MTNKIQDFIYNLWTSNRPTKTKADGWVSGNAVCCVHNNDTADKRGRGGLILDPATGGVGWHCFNCGFTTTWQPGWYLGYKLRRLLKWMGASESDVNALVLEAIKERTATEGIRSLIIPAVKEEFRAHFDPKPLPDKSVSFREWATMIAMSENVSSVPHNVLDAVSYVHDRGIDLNRYEFYWSETVPNRVIIPFTWQGKIIGYSARGLTDKVKPKYLHQMDQGYVFNVDKQRPEWQYVIVTEGVFDAMAINATAVLHAEINKKQIDLLESLNKEIVVLPDVDTAGSRLIDVALENGWSVSFPIWMETCKDAAQAVEKYGAPFTLMDTLRHIETSRIKIELKRRKMKL